MYTQTVKKKKVKKKSKAAIIELNSELNPGLEFFKLLNVKGIAGNKEIYKKYLQKVLHCTGIQGKVQFYDEDIFFSYKEDEKVI